MAGIFNPGGLEIDGRIHLLCRAEASEATWKGAFHESQAAAFWCALDNDLSLSTYAELSYDGTDEYRPEDWRLFRHEERLFSNHSVYSGSNLSPRCHIAISEIDLDRGHLSSRKILETPFQAQPEEKNWVMFSDAGRLLCIYSIDPYVVFEVGLKHRRTRIVLNDGRFRFALRYKPQTGLFNSTNPVAWGSDHYLTFIHTYMRSCVRGDRNRLYMQYAMLIDRHTLLPVSVIPEPIVIGGAEEGRHSGVHYTMSLVNAGDDLYAFFGEGDSHTGMLVIDKDVLNQNFQRHFR